MTIDQFVAKYNGVHVDEDGYYGAQCWDIVARYAREVVGCPSFPTGSGGAEGLFRIFANPIPQYFDRIANDTNNPNQLPVKGDIIVWNSSFSPPWGHTALVLSANSSGVTVLEQNGNNPGGVTYKTTRGWSKVSGWLRPKSKGEDMITDTDNQFYRWNKLHSQILGFATDRGSFRANAVGKTWLGAMEFLSDHKFAVENAKNVEIGSLARRDNWQGQIYSLQDAVKARDGIINQNTQDIIELRKQIADLADRPTKSQLEEIQNSISGYEKKAMDAQAELEKSRAELDKYKSEDKATENAVLTWLKAIFRIGTK